MIKITTKRDELEEEALREEGRREESQRVTDAVWGEIRDRSWIHDNQVELILVSDLNEGDTFVEVSTPRGFYRAARVTRIGDTDSKGIALRDPEGTAWVEYEYLRARGGTAGSLLKRSDTVLVEVADNAL